MNMAHLRPCKGRWIAAGLKKLLADQSKIPFIIRALKNCGLKMKQQRVNWPQKCGVYLPVSLKCLPLYHHSPLTQRNRL